MSFVLFYIQTVSQDLVKMAVCSMKASAHVTVPIITMESIVRVSMEGQCACDFPSDYYGIHCEVYR